MRKWERHFSVLRAQRLQERDDAGGGPEMRFVRLLTTLYRASRTPLRITSTHFVPVDSHASIALAARRLTTLHACLRPRRDRNDAGLPNRALR